MSTIDKCYGKWYGQIPECKDCPPEYKEYCRTCKNPKLLDDMGHEKTISFDEISFAEDIAGCHQNFNFDEADEIEEKLYTRREMLELISFMAILDPKTLEVLDEKIKDPNVEFSKIAKRQKVSRQAIHQLIQRRCAEVPELEVILRNRKRNIENAKQPSFMEAVCQIRKQTASQKKLKKQKNGSKYSRKLISLSQSLDLSRMSILKGGSILRLDLNS
jgi:predicted DNA-binding protein YlxM (UPF0122 family)